MYHFVIVSEFLVSPVQSNASMIYPIMMSNSTLGAALHLMLHSHWIKLYKKCGNSSQQEVTLTTQNNMAHVVIFPGFDVLPHHENI